MKWTPHEIIANICGIFASYFVSRSMPAPPSVSSLAAGVAEGAIKGITFPQKLSSEQGLQTIIQCAIKKALDEAREISPFELPQDCEMAIIEGAFSPENVILYLKTDDQEQLFRETITSIICSYDECDVATVPIDLISDHILRCIDADIQTDNKAMLQFNHAMSKVMLQEIQGIGMLLAEEKESFHDALRIRENSIRCLREYQTNVRFSYYNQRIDPAIVPNIHADSDLLTVSELISWIERRNITRIQLIGEGGTGKTSLLLSLWEHLVTCDQCTNYFVNMVKLNQINNMSENEASRFLITEFSKKLLFDDTYLSKKQINDAFKMLSATGRQADKCKYVLLLDGFNEIRSEYQKKIISQFNELECCQNVIIVLTSRFRLGPQQLAYAFFPAWISPLSEETVSDYLEQHGKGPPEHFYRLLCNPMMLTVYCETNRLNQENSGSRLFLFPEKIETKYDLMRAFFEGLACKEYNLDGNLTSLVGNLFAYNYILPHIAAEMDDQYDCSYQKVKACIKSVCTFAKENSSIFRAAFDERDLNQQWTELIEQPDLYDIIRKYLLENPTVFLGSDARDGGTWLFIHQEYRDYCKLKYYAVCLSLVLEEDGRIPALSEPQLISAIIKTRKKMWRYPNRYWAAELENMPGKNALLGEPSAHYTIGPTNVYAIMRTVIHFGAQLTAGKLCSDNSQRRILMQSVFLSLIRCMDLESMVVGTSNLKELYLDALLYPFRTEQPKLEISHSKLEEAAHRMMRQLEENESEVDYDIQLPTQRQIVDCACNDEFFSGYKIILSCRGSLGALFGVLGIILDIYPLIPTTFKDYVSVPKANGYQALHMGINIGIGPPVEVIIRQTKKLRSKP